MTQANYAFSKTTLSFYPYELKDAYDAAGTWPSDAVDIADEVFEAYAFATPPSGKTRGADSSGMPAWVDIPAPTAAQILEINTQTQAQLQKAASIAIAPLQLALTLGSATASETAQAKSWLAYSQALAAIDLTQAAPAWPTLPAAGA